MVDNVPIIFESLTHFLTPAKAFEVVGMIRFPELCLAELRKSNPHVIVIEPAAPKGIETIREIANGHAKIKILAFSANPSLAPPAFAAGVHGFLVKASHPKELTLALHVVLEGGTYLDEAAAALIRAHLPREPIPPGLLSPEESEIAPLLLAGLTSKEIAGKQKCTTRHVEHLRAKMMAKLGAKNSAALWAKLNTIRPGRGL